MLPVGLAIVAFSAKALAAAKAAGLPRTVFDVRDMASAYANGVYPYTPAAGLMNGLRVFTELLLSEGLDNVHARHRRVASGVRAAVAAWGLELFASDPSQHSDTVSAIRTPEGFDASRIVAQAAQRYDVAFGSGLGDVAGRLFRIGHLGSMTDTMALAGIATAEMAMADVGLRDPAKIDRLARLPTDTKGKQEVETELVAKATVFTGEVAQSVTIGEAQHAVAMGLIREGDITEIGAVPIGKHPGRSSAEEITLFDGTGVGLQDHAVASVAVDRAVAKGAAIEVDF